jgi:glyoxylase-like metal-dependent hydrolase (beta-lactamase superfamily II)/ferredoxin
MADVKKRLSTNVAGNFFVDATCINCDTCRQLAPRSFREEGEYSAVVRQPAGDVEVDEAYQALLACPVGSIGTLEHEPARLKAAMAGFPMRVDREIYYCGFNSEKSFGANSYLIQHPDGNWLVDSPRYLKHLVEAIARLGGIRYIFLTHEDDVADADRYARRFKATRIIHRADAHAVPGAECVIEGTEPIRIAPEFLVIPVPGHTPGSQTLLYREQVLFSGDHLWWDRDRASLGAPERLIWDRDSLLRSIARLQAYRFEWVLPGHGERKRLPAEQMAAQLRRLLEYRRTSSHVALVKMMKATAGPKGA